VGAQESTKAAATAGTSQPYVCRPGLKQILSDVSNGAGAGLKQQARVAGTRPTAEHAENAETRKASDVLATTSAASVKEKTLGISSASPANAKKPVISNFLEPASSNDLDGKRRELKNPRKSELATEKTTGHKVIDNCKSKIESFVCSAQAKTASNPDSKGKPAVNIERLYSFHESQTVLSDPSSTASQTTRIANDAPRSNGAGGVSQQMATSIEGSLRQADMHLTIHLNPPELGRVFVRFQQEQDQITILLEVSKPQTRREIDLALPQIMRSLQDAGVQVRRLEVSAPAGSDELQQQPDTGAPGQNNGEMSPHHFAGQDDSDPHHIGAAHSNTNDEGSFPESLTSTFKDHYQDESVQLLVFTGGSINMLI
jgi:flagellar hook-length control protein FliK